MFILFISQLQFYSNTFIAIFKKKKTWNWEPKQNRNSRLMDSKNSFYVPRMHLHCIDKNILKSIPRASTETQNFQQTSVYIKK